MYVYRLGEVPKLEIYTEPVLKQIQLFMTTLLYKECKLELNKIT